MPKLVLFNKPFNVLSQFTPIDSKSCLADYIPSDDFPKFYPAGRLDFDSEGLLLLSDNGSLIHRITSPKHKMEKTYWVQVEGEVSTQAINALRQGPRLNDGKCKPAKAKLIAAPDLWPRDPPIRSRASIPTAWLEIKIKEGKNRQIRRMTAAVGHPTLRLVRVQIGSWRVADLSPGQLSVTQVHL